MRLIKNRIRTLNPRNSLDYSPTAGTGRDAITEKRARTMESTESNEIAMTFWEHLEELRRRIIISAIAIAVFTVLSLSFSKAH